MSQELKKKDEEYGRALKQQKDDINQLRERMRQTASGLKEAAVTSGWDFGVVGKLSEPRAAETAEELFERAKLLHKATGPDATSADFLDLDRPLELQSSGPPPRGAACGATTASCGGRAPRRVAASSSRPP